MRYPSDHKARTRERIVQVAARLFRRHGYDGVSIDSLMEACGLTRGGFYGHFASKQALYRAVLQGQHGLIHLLQSRDATEPDDLRAQADRIMADYLEPAHRSRVVRGCTIAALATETSRAGGPAQRAYARAVRELADEFRRSIKGSKDADERALAAIAVSIGGLLVSSACAADSELSDAISAAARKSAARLLDT